MTPRAGSLAAQANVSAASVKPRSGGRSHKRARVKEREWKREKARLMREKR